MQTVLNTQGGPLGNNKAEVLDTNEQPIPHLYSAGEFGGICTNDYQGGSNIAECLIFGKIAGESAAKEKPDTITSASVKETEQQKVDTKVTLLKADNYAAKDFVTHDNQYIGRSTGGIGDEMVVRITVGSDSSLQNVEVLKQSETEHGTPAIKQMPQEMVAKNTYDIDSISGASSTSNALKAAVKDALDKAKQTITQ